MEKKLTKKDMFEVLKAVVDDCTTLEDSAKGALQLFLDNEIRHIVAKKVKSKSKSSETKNVVLDCLIEAAKPVTVTELQKSFPVMLCDFSNQKISAMLRLLVGEGAAVKTVVKGKSYFAIADTAEPTDTAEPADTAEVEQEG